MPSYPATITEAQQKAGKLAGKFVNYQCVECAMEIARAIGPGVDASVYKLRALSEAGGEILLSARNMLISTTGHHVGIRIGDSVYDNHHPQGVPATAWAALYTDVYGGNLLLYERPVKSFFGRMFLRRRFSAFASSRFQIEEGG